MHRRSLLATLAGATAAYAQKQSLDITQFEPKSALEVKQTPVLRAKFPVIDIHTHLSWAAKGEKGVSLTGDRKFIMEPADLLKVMDAKNLHTMVNLTGGYGDGLRHDEHLHARGLFERAVKVYGGDRALALSAALRAGEMAAKLGDTRAAVGWFEQVLADTPGPARGDARRLTATLSLARVLAARGDARERVCDLLTEGRAALTPGDERRTASDAVFVANCGPSPGP